MAQGYRIVARRFRSKRGEVDLVASRRGVLAFVEVKRRRGEVEARESVGYKQRKRIEAAAADWLAKNQRTGKKSPAGVRFDVIAIVPWRLPTHIKDAWRPDLQKSL